MYKARIGHTGCLYGTPIKIKEKIPLESHVYVIEMNNSINKIEGIGLFVNREYIPIWIIIDIFTKVPNI
jgi:hypothetical protein